MLHNVNLSVAVQEVHNNNFILLYMNNTLKCVIIMGNFNKKFYIKKYH